MSMDFLDSLIARELGTAARVRPVPAFYGDALEEQVEREPEPGPLPPPSSSRAPRRDRPADPSRGLPARPPREASASEPPEERPAAQPASMPSRPPAGRPVPPGIVAPAPQRPDRVAHPDLRALEPVSRPAQGTQAAGAVEPAAETEASPADADEAEAPAAARVDTSAAAARPAAIPGGSFTPAVPPPALRAARGTTDAAGDEAAITISIGRIDVRAAAPPAPVPAPLPRRPSTSLDEWLAECDATGRG